MSAPAGLGDSEILDHIARQPHARAGYKQLVRELGARSFAARTELEQALGRLTAQGDLIEFGAGQYVVTSRSREFATGRLEMHRNGYGFVVSEHPIETLRGDVFIPPRPPKRRCTGDRVLVRIGRVGAEGRAEGEIMRILRRAHLTVVGEFRGRGQGAAMSSRTTGEYSSGFDS